MAAFFFYLIFLVSSSCDYIFDCRFAMDLNLDNNSALSTTFSTETLVARDMVPQGFDNTQPARPLTEMWIEGRKYLVVEQSANLRKGSKMSKIWRYRRELRALDTPKLDKY
jgi:hypothetical protein